MEVQQDLLADIEQEVYLDYATPGQRFANGLIDMAVFYVFLLLIGGLMGFLFPEMFINRVDDSLFGNKALDYLFTYSIYILIYTLIEGLSKGKTLGKLITGTKAVYEDGTPINFATAFTRSLSRVVPFEAFSAFATIPWHDKWTGTRVIKTR